MLKLFLVYAHSESEQNELFSKSIQALEKELAIREGVIKEIKVELSEIEAETRTNMTINIEWCSTILISYNHHQKPNMPAIFFMDLPLSFF